MFHDDGRYFSKDAKTHQACHFVLYQTESRDGGLTWSNPQAIYTDQEIHLCEPGLIRSPDGKSWAVLLRENRRRKNSHIIFSNDEGRTWTTPRPMTGDLTGDRHTAVQVKDGRLFVSFRDMSGSETKGDWVAWVGTYQDLVENRPGEYRIRLMKNHKSTDCAYPGVELLPDNTIVTTTYGHWTRVKLLFCERSSEARRNRSASPKVGFGRWVWWRSGVNKGEIAKISTCRGNATPLNPAFPEVITFELV